ncbi:FCD domain-containing protein [Jhaorihella thermophila]
MRCLPRFGRSDGMGDLNRKFHATLYAAANLPYHMKVINSAMDQIDRYLRAQLLLSKGMERANKEHLAILAACEAGESEKGASADAAAYPGRQGLADRPSEIGRAFPVAGACRDSRLDSGRVGP